MTQKQRTRFLYATAFVALSALATWCWSYNTLEHRLEREAAKAYRLASTEYGEAGVAHARLGEEMTPILTATGTNAIPILLKWIEHPTSPNSLKKHLGRLAFRCGVKSPKFWDWAVDHEEEHRALTAACSMHLFGTNVDVAVPRLQEQTNDNQYAQMALERVMTKQLLP